MSDFPPQPNATVLSSEAVIRLSKNARQLFRQREYIQACKLYRQGLATNQDNPYLLSGMGDACREAGDFVSAQQAYQRLLELDPQNLFALRGQGDLFKAKGRLTEAIPLWELYLDLRPGDVHVMTRIADACKKLERYAPARDLYQQILAIDAMDRFALTGLADLLHRTGCDLEAIACYEKILTMRHDMLHILTIVGKLCWRVSDYVKAEQFFLQALDIDPDNPYALYGLGNCYRWHREYGKAVEVWQRILQHNEGTIALYSRMGDAYTHLGDLSSAEQAYRRVLDQGYDHFAQIGLIKLLCEQGNFCRAIKELNDLLANEEDPWSQLDELNRRFVRCGRRQTMITFYSQLLDTSVPDSIDPERVRRLLVKLESN